MGTSRYHEYLRSEKWRQISEHVKQRDNHECQNCYYKMRLEVHHTSYKTLYHEEENDFADLVTLCHYCHHRHHEQLKEQQRETWQELYQRILKLGT